ncbi:AI-2E family transporter [Candidatus Gracilibacteria bacterium]|nr:AI-2E family transporter [Candidatus Gracilibacteria bacterium]
MAGIKVFEQLQGILITVGVAAFLAIGLTPVLDKIEEHRIPRPIAILILYILFLGAISLLFIKVVPIIARQLMDIARDLADFVSNQNGGTLSLPFLERFGLRFEMGEIQHLLSNNLASISKTSRASPDRPSVSSEESSRAYLTLFSRLYYSSLYCSNGKPSENSLSLFSQNEIGNTSKQNSYPYRPKWPNGSVVSFCGWLS